MIQQVMKHSKQNLVKIINKFLNLIQPFDSIGNEPRKTNIDFKKELKIEEKDLEFEDVIMKLKECIKQTLTTNNIKIKLYSTSIEYIIKKRIHQTKCINSKQATDLKCEAKILSNLKKKKKK